MSRGDTTGGRFAIASSDRSRQVALVAIAILGLLLAALAVPPAVPPVIGAGGGLGDNGTNQTGGGGGNATGQAEGNMTGTDSGGEEGGSNDRQVDGRGPDGRQTDGGGEINMPGSNPGGNAPFVNWSRPSGEETEGSTNASRNESADVGCLVVFAYEPVPGTTVPLYVWHNESPVVDRAVYYDGDFVGTTDDRGGVYEPIPYTQNLTVSVDLPPGVADCRFENGNGVVPWGGERLDLDRDTEGGDSQQTALGTARGGRGLGSEHGGGGVGMAHSQTGAGSVYPSSPRQSTEPGNDSDTYTIDEQLNLTVLDDPLPGGPVTLAVRLRSVPVADAAVTVDGETVGQTDDSGQIELTVPADGSDAMEVRVVRGDFTAETTIDIPSLSLSVRSPGALTIPGDEAVVHASFDDQPAENATVFLDGKRLGTTDENGDLVLALPASYDATVTVESHNQSASAPLWPVYVSTVLFWAGFLLVATVTTVAAYRRSGSRAGRPVALFWVFSGLVLAALTVVGSTAARLVALGGVAVLALAVLLTNRERAGDAVSDGRSFLVRLAARIRRGLLALTRGLERVILTILAGLERFRAWLGTLPASISGLARRLGAWLATVPGKLRAGLLAAGHTVRGLLSRLSHSLTSREALVGAIVIGGAAALGHWRYGGDGLVAGLLLGSIVVTMWLLSRRGESTEQRQRTDPNPGTSPEATSVDVPDGEARRRTLRELWRDFARQVRPGRWRESTPGEVARDALDSGYPQEAVTGLTRAFRDVEYGAYPSEQRWRQAKAAAERLEGHEDAEEVQES